VVTAWLLLRIAWDTRSATRQTIDLLFGGQFRSAVTASLASPPLATILFILLGLPVYLILSSRRVRAADD
jgi:hypothetical protein